MRLKTYRAPDLDTALARARAELGPDALVLATNTVRGRLGLTQIEITVAAERPRADAARLGVDAAVPASVARVPSSAPPARRSPVENEADARDLARAIAPLVSAGLPPDLARRFARIAGVGRTREDLAAATEAAVGQLLPFATAPLDVRVLFVVGPPGAGKTTTVAKLAARIVFGQRRPARIAQADAQRVGAWEQTAILSRCLEIPASRVRAGDDLAEARRKAGGRGTVLVDTAGIGARDRDRLVELVALRETSRDAAVILLVPAGLHAEEAARILDRFAPLRPTSVALSKVDDGARPGELIAALTPAGLPLAFLTHGQRVPDDLTAASPRVVAGLLLGAHSPESLR